MNDSDVYAQAIMGAAVLCGAISFCLLVAGAERASRTLFVTTFVLAFLIAPLTYAFYKMKEDNQTVRQMEARGCQWEIINGRRTIRSDGPGCGTVTDMTAGKKLNAEGRHEK